MLCVISNLLEEHILTKCFGNKSEGAYSPIEIIPKIFPVFSVTLRYLSFRAYETSEVYLRTYPLYVAMPRECSRNRFC